MRDVSCSNHAIILLLASYRSLVFNQGMLSWDEVLVQEMNWWLAGRLQCQNMVNTARWRGRWKFWGIAGRCLSFGTCSSPARGISTTWNAASLESPGRFWR